MFLISFMFDNHTFERVTGKDRDTLIKQATGLFRSDGCGSLFVRDQWGGHMNALTLHGHRMKDDRYGVRPDEIEAWADKVMAELSFQTLMV